MISSTSKPTAHMLHECSGCDTVIRPGETYLRYFAAHEGETLDSGKLCAGCDVTMHPHLFEPEWWSVAEWIKGHGGHAATRDLSYYHGYWRVPEVHFDVEYDGEEWSRCNAAGIHKFSLVELLQWIQSTDLPELPEAWRRWLERQSIEEAA